MKKSVILTVLSILLIPLAFAAHTASVTTTYSPVYETNPVNITLMVENGLFSTASINNVNIQTSGFAINNIVNLLGWTNNNTLNFLTSTNAVSNWGMQRFGFEATANNVNQDTTYDWNLTTTDTNSDSQANAVQITVLNDNTPPVITQTLPGQFIRGNDSELFELDANDPETGIANSNLYLSNCDLIYDNATNSSSVVYSTIPLTCSNNICPINQDLSSWNEGDVCFYYDVSNKGGETAVTNNLTTIIDRTPPTVALVSPADGTFLNLTSVDLQFNAIDNYDTNLDCNVLVNGNSNAVTGTGNLTYNLVVNDGQYTWNAECTDEVGLIGTAQARTFTVDNQGPNITIDVPSVNNRGSDIVINVDITDLGSGVDQSSIAAEITDTNGNITQVTMNNGQIIYPTTLSTVPGTYSVTVSAKDNIGQSTTQTVQFRIRETYIITMSLSQTQIDASTPNLTRYVNLTGNILRDDGVIPAGTIEVTEILATENLNIDNLTGNFATQVEIPQANGGYRIIALFVNGIDNFTQESLITVGPYCGNGIIDQNEECDTTTTATCSDYGFSQGTVSCVSCTIDHSLCSNPPSSHHSSGGSSTFVQVTQPEVVVEEPLDSGVVNTSHSEEQPIAEEPKNSGVVYTPEPTVQNQTESGFGIGASWSAFTVLVKGINSGLLLAILIIGILLYIFGWKREDEWDRYFRKHGNRKDGF